MIFQFPDKAIPKFSALLLIGALAAGCVSSDGLESATTTNASTNIDGAPSGEPSATDTAAITDIMTVTNADLGTVPTKRPEIAESQSTTSVMAALPTDESGPGIQAVGEATGEVSGQVIDELTGELVPPPTIGPQKTYLINGLLSAVPFIGYGFRNLKKKMPDAKLYSYMGVVEGPAVIAPAIVKEAEAAYRANPTTAINLIGISLGADLITVIAAKLADKDIPVNYFGIVDGTHLQPIQANVRKADNLTCSNLDCTRAKVRLAPGNTTTKLDTKVYSSSHIPLGDLEEMHTRVISQSSSL